MAAELCQLFLLHKYTCVCKLQSFMCLCPNATGPPSAPVNLTVDTDGITNTTVSISWSPPANNGGRDDTRYNVFYQLSGWLHLGFIEGSQGVLGLRATVQGLLPVREYVIRVVAENGVSDQVGTTEGRFADIRATTTEGGKAL